MQANGKGAKSCQINLYNIHRLVASTLQRRVGYGNPFIAKNTYRPNNTKYHLDLLSHFDNQ